MSHRHNQSVGGVLAQIPFWLLIILPALVVVPGARDPFRAPKLLVSEWLAILALLPCLIVLWRENRSGSRALIRHPAFQLTLPVLLVAAASGFGCRYLHHYRDAMTSLFIASIFLVAVSAALSRKRLWKLLTLLTVPATALSILALLQFHDFYQPFSFQGEAPDRLAVTSLAGSAGDLAGYLVLPVLLAQLKWWQCQGRKKLMWSLLTLLFTYAILATQTLSAMVALAASSAVLWWRVLKGRPRLVAALTATLLAAAALSLPPIKDRLQFKAKLIESRDWNGLLTGRLDGWQVALWLFESQPVNGVGHGAYKPEFVDARLALAKQGTRFYKRQHQVVFANAHNEVLEVAAEWGVLGVLTAFWVCLVICRRVFWRSTRGSRSSPLQQEELAFTWAGLTAYGVLSMVSFPFRVALVAYPMLFFLAWMLSDAEEDS